MSARSSKFLTLFILVFLAGTLLAFRMISRRPEAQIRRIFRRSKYSKMIPLIIAQAKHETANFTSNIFRTQNNAFSIKHAFKRKDQPGFDEGKAHRSYKNVKDSARDLLDLFEWNNFNPNLTNAMSYAMALKADHYYEATADSYAKGINSWLE